MNRPWMPLYVADYRGDTARLSTLEHGAYLLLIMEYWQVGGLPEDDAQLARIVGLPPAGWRKIRPTIVSFFHDGWKHKRIDAELARASEISTKRRASAQQRHSKQDANAPANAPANTEQLDTHARASSPSHLQRKEEPAGAGSSSKIYAFETGVIRLNEKDFNQWKQAFSHLSLEAELIALTDWAGQQSNWFVAVSGALAKKNREIGTRLEQSKSDGLTNDDRYWGKGRIPGIQ